MSYDLLKEIDHLRNYVDLVVFAGWSVLSIGGIAVKNDERCNVPSVLKESLGHVKSNPAAKGMPQKINGEIGMNFFDGTQIEL